MTDRLSGRLSAAVDALPLSPGLRVVEIGCGPGAAAREIARRVGPRGAVLGIDRSAHAIATARSTQADRLPWLSFQRAEIEEFVASHHARFDIAIALRVGVLDGRHPDRSSSALQCIADLLTPAGRLYVDGGCPLREVDLTGYR
ncbi:methyltransferase domain-containing protein [Gordonia soli]|uniref:Methyltransferase domain-containing protein n=1 Tax=Gordonia soli NBRC 108243 TaxID=1223545 RepID=M0QLV3_9ACTN|nr:methyltransferase domain-containing protein [Gordonia soli]GAC69655.1 hypothetical protein GS4_26_01030 [Gordonia soli NBRC 108243]